ncbi:hypothetical protein C1H46_037612 [Malus baccata]|uniref:Uncharacterized protein n=1 Tax=Malus baccata TaxID=106549 RepID=A0A540KRJ9_MALBA|nr:hypothetical protein C1H46_037612 [Malus baccata]
MVSIPDVDGDLSLGVLSLPATAISPIPFMDRWSKLPPTGDLGFLGTILRLCAQTPPVLQIYSPIPHTRHCLLLQFWGISSHLLYAASGQRQLYVVTPAKVWTGFVAFRMGLVLPDLQVGLLFANFEALMGFCIALCGGISQFFCSPVVSIFSAAIEAAIDSRFRVIRFFKGVTFGPLWVDSGFWAEPHIL